MCTQAALLAGFAYSGLTQVAIPHESHYILKLLYLIVTTTAMCLDVRPPPPFPPLFSRPTPKAVDSVA